MTPTDDVLVSVIIPHRDTPAELARCLDSLDAQKVGFDYEVLVVDGSTHPPHWVEAWPRARLLFEPPTGPGPARNRGAAAARARLLAFIDADCRVAYGWLQALVDAFARHPEVDLLGGPIQMAPAEVDAWTPTGVFESVFSYKQEIYVRRLRFSATANLATRAGVFTKVGGFAGLNILEDLEWCQRATRAGFSIAYAADMLVLHEPRASFRELAGKWRRHVHQEYHTDVAAGSGRLAYAAKIAKVALATPAALLYLLCHPRHTMRQRLGAVSTVWRIRMIRTAAMIRLALDSDQPQPPWNG